MKLTKDTLFPYLIYNKPFIYDNHITLYPVTMNDIVLFQSLTKAITLRKNSIFHEKKIIKMTYYDFLIYSFGNDDLETQYNIPGLSTYFFLAYEMLKLCCKDGEVTVDQYMKINGEIVTPKIFDDLRRIIIIQNDIDFDIDEFINYDTEQSLLRAANQQNSTKNKANIEDYIDSLVIAMHSNESDIMNMTIRKFWRYIKRYQLHESYTIAKTGECSGMVKFKETIPYWITSLDDDDKYKNLKTDENEIRSKVG